MAKELLVKEEISREEKIYRDALELRKAVSYILRFENRVAALRNAAKKFEMLENYKDAKVNMEECRTEAAKVAKEGTREVFEEAVKREERAKSKSDYVDALTEFKRVSKKGDYTGQAQQHIRVCKRKIARLETYAVWKRRFKAVAVIVIGLFLLSCTPLYPFAKGYAHQQMGEYKAALANYKQSGISWAKDLEAACYYEMGMEALERGEEEKALRFLHKGKKRGNTKAKKAYRKLKRKMDSEEQMP